MNLCDPTSRRDWYYQFCLIQDKTFVLVTSCFSCGPQSLESLLKVKTLELEQVSATCQNLRWLKEEMEAKSCSRQKEQEGIIQQLQTCLHDRNKEVEVRPWLGFLSLQLVCLQREWSQTRAC